MEKSHFVGCFIIDENNSILLQFRGPRAKKLKNCWNCFGGKVEDNEELRQALSRELKEELNILVEENEFSHLSTIKFYEKENGFYGYLSYFRFVINNEQKNSLKLQEGNGWGFFSREEIMELPTTPNLKKIIPLLD